ncbi:hypothetical protein Lal_00021339 [Lupinus albus]|nr:hypothetical protein Lal_00021339 [Lupinus albus]
MSSQNEVDEEGTMVNTQTPITQTPEPQTPQTQTQKRKPRGIITMKSVVRSRSNNNKLTVEWNAKGQPLNNKGGNKLVSNIGVMVPQNISIKWKHWSDDRLNAVKDIIWKDITIKCLARLSDNLEPIAGNVSEMLKAMYIPAKYANLIEEADWIEFVTHRTQDEKLLKISEQNRKRASNPIYPYRASRMGYRRLEQSKIPPPSSAAVDLDVLWVDAHKNKQCVIDNEKVQEAVNRVVTLKERETFRTVDSQVILEKALGLPQYPVRIRGARFGSSK